MKRDYKPSLRQNWQPNVQINTSTTNFSKIKKASFLFIGCLAAAVIAGIIIETHHKAAAPKPLENIQISLAIPTTKTA